MGRVTVGPSSEARSIPSLPALSAVVIEKPIEIEKIVTVEKIIEVIKIEYVDRIIEKIVPGPERIIVEHKTVEIPMIVEKIIIQKIPVIKEVIREVLPKVVDISKAIELKREKSKNKMLFTTLVCSIILNLILVVMNVK